MNFAEMTVQEAIFLHAIGFDLVIEHGEVVRYEKDVDCNECCNGSSFESESDQK